jgi:hypothetical protein
MPAEKPNKGASDTERSPQTKQNPSDNPSAPIQKGDTVGSEPTAGIEHKTDEAQQTNWLDSFLYDINITDAMIALFTGLLAVYTYLLYRSADKLWQAGERQFGVTRQSADAATKAADVAEASLYKLERPFAIVVDQGMRTLDRGTSDDDVVPRFRIAEPPTFWMDLINYGKTPAIITSIATKGFVGTEFPADPDYEETVRRRIILRNSKPMGEIRFALADIGTDDIDRVDTGTARAMVYGRIKYKDVFSRRHAHGFGLSLDTKNGRLYHDGGAAYNYDKPDEDPDDDA